MANGHVQNDATKKAIATLAKCLSSSAGFVPLSSSISRASFTESAPLQRSIPRENKNLNFFATFSRLAIPPSHRIVEIDRLAAGLPRFRAHIRDWRTRNDCQSQKSCNLCRYFVSEPRDIGWRHKQAGSHCRGRPREGAIGQIDPCRNFLPISPSGRCKNNQKRLRWNKKGSA